MRASIFILLFGFFSIFTLSAQSFELRLKYNNREQETAHPVEGVKVIVENSQTHQKKEATTGPEGIATFKLEAGPMYLLSIPIEEHETELETSTFRGNGKLTINYLGYSPQYYRKMAIEDSLYAIQSAKQEAEWKRIAAENAKKPGTMLFYVINSEGVYTAGVKVYDGDKNEKLIGENNYFWKGETCTSSVDHNENKMSITKPPGTYSYYAVSGNGQYEWAGQYTITGNRTNKLALKLAEARKVK